jgi:hypothetical protein
MQQNISKKLDLMLDIIQNSFRLKHYIGDVQFFVAKRHI